MSTTTEKVRSALRRLELSENEQAIYLSLLTEGKASARLLASRTGLTRPSVYDQIKTLKKLSLVNELDVESKALYAAGDVNHLLALLEDRIDHLEQSRDFLESALPALRDSMQTVEPKVRFFYGADGVKQLLKDVMWYDKQTIQMVWSHDEMSDVYDEKFLTWFDDRRAKRQLAIHSLWPQQLKKESSLFTSLGGDERRQLPAVTPKMSFLLYGQKTAYISSPTESFGYIVESAEHHNLIKLQFELMWNNKQ